MRRCVWGPLCLTIQLKYLEEILKNYLIACGHPLLVQEKRKKMVLPGFTPSSTIFLLLGLSQKRLNRGATGGSDDNGIRP